MPTATMPASTFAGEVAIEIHVRRNGNFLWPIGHISLRGAWRRDELTHGEINEETYRFPLVIPGQHVVLNTVTREVHIRDPLNSPRYREARTRTLDAVCKLFDQPAGSYAAEKDVTIQLRDFEVKNWLHQMRKHVDADLARVVSGTLPTADEIALMPGQVQFGHFANSGRSSTWRD